MIDLFSNFALIFWYLTQCSTDNNSAISWESNGCNVYNV